MTELALHQHATTFSALQLARLWCDGHRIGRQDALTHALRVVDVLLRHVPDAAPEVVAAALLHNSPDLVPPEVDLHAVLVTLISPEVARLVQALAREHDGLTGGNIPAPPVHDPGLMQASVADKIVSIQAVLDSARNEEPATFWGRRHAFIEGLSYFHSTCDAAADVLPSTMVNELSALVRVAEERIAEARTGS